MHRTAPSLLRRHTRQVPQGAHVADSLCAACGLADASSTHWRERLFQTAAASTARPFASFCSCDKLATTLLDARSSLAVPVRPLPAAPQRVRLLGERRSAGAAVLGSCRRVRLPAALCSC